MHDILHKIGRWVLIEPCLVQFHLIFWSSSYFNPGVMASYVMQCSSRIIAICLAAGMHVRWCSILEYDHATSWKIGRWAWIYSWMYLFQLIFGSSSYFKHGNMPILHTQYVECEGSVCRLPQGIWTDVSEYDQDTSSIIGRWTWINSWMDLFYVIFGSSSYFDKGDHDHVIPYIINQKTSGTLW